MADYFFYEVVNARSYVTGGTSNGEAWLAPAAPAGRRTEDAASNTAECCCAYNMLKLARHLYGWNADPALLRLLRAAAAESPASARSGRRPGYTQYYLSLTPGAWKTFNTEDQTFWCCTGSGVEEYSKLNDSIYWHDGEGSVRQPVHPVRAGLAGEGVRSCGRRPSIPSAEHHADA